jgi:hypothetical protein
MDYKMWLRGLKYLLVYHKLMKPNIDLCPKGWRMYFDEGLTPSQAIKEDIGNVNPFYNGE